MNAPTPDLLAETCAARVTPQSVPARLSLRGRGALGQLEQALGIALPVNVGRRSSADDLEALCLGPDEWVLLAPEAAQVKAACAAVYEDVPHSLVDISGREVTFRIEGSRAAELLTLGIARDIAAIPVGEGRRTVFDGVTVVLWRDAEQSFRMDVWNSFAPHVLELLEVGCRELAAERL
jgi:sarcosine oxidase subunit gamma